MLELQTKGGYTVTINSILTDFDVFVGVEYAHYTDRQGPQMDISVGFYDRWGGYLGPTFKPHTKEGSQKAIQALVLPVGKDLYNLIQENDEKENNTL